jgi:hypothetical protein
MLADLKSTSPSKQLAHSSFKAKSSIKQHLPVLYENESEHAFNSEHSIEAAPVVSPLPYSVEGFRKKSFDIIRPSGIVVNNTAPLSFFSPIISAVADPWASVAPSWEDSLPQKKASQGLTGGFANLRMESGFI